MIKELLSAINQSVENAFWATWILLKGVTTNDDHWLSLITEEDDMDIPDINVSVQEDKIYWIADDRLMVASVVDGEVDTDSSEPFEAEENASDDDLMWMFNMIDGLRSGEEIYNEDSPAWNQGI